MFFVTLESETDKDKKVRETYKVVFNHFEAEQPEITMITAASILRHEICAEETTGVAPGEVAKGFSRCSRDDRFCRNKGRKLALGRALQAIPKSQRIHFWKAYFDTRHGKY